MASDNTASTTSASQGLTLDLIAGTAARWAMVAVVIPAAVTGAYWGITSLTSAGQGVRDLNGQVANLQREIERVDRAQRVGTDEAFKAVEGAQKRGQERREAIERDMRERTTAVDARIGSLEDRLATLTGGVIELRTEQRSIKAGVDRIEGAVQGLSARPTPTIPVLGSANDTGRATPVRNWSSSR